MADRYHLLSIGQAVLDIVCRCDDKFLQALGLTKGRLTKVSSPTEILDITSQLPSGLQVSGGSAANVAAGIASLGGHSAFIGRIAKDSYGRMFSHDIRGIGVSFETPPASISFRGTSHSLILLTPDGQRTMVTYLGCSTGLEPSMVNPELVAQSEVIYLEGYLFDCRSAAKIIDKAVGLARAAGRLVAVCLPELISIEEHREDIRRLVEHDADIVFGNEEELKSLYRSATLDQALGQIGNAVDIAVVTRSENGAVVLSKGNQVLGSAERIPRVVDTTGAGDLYASGFIFAQLQGADLQASMRLASFAAAEIVSLVGARPEVRLEHLAKLRGFVGEIIA